MKRKTGSRDVSIKAAGVKAYKKIKSLQYELSTGSRLQYPLHPHFFLQQAGPFYL
jgi:hypothetical protein